MSINPNDFDQNEAWILFQLNDAPVRTEMDGDFNIMAIMDVATGLMLGVEFVGIPTEELSEFAYRKLLASAETEAGEYPRQILVNSMQNVHQLVTASNAKGIEVVSESEGNLDPITKEAREGFITHVSGTKRH